VAYEEELAERIRELLHGEPDVTEMSAFGGLAFMVNGNVAVSASGQGGLLVRVEPGETESLLDDPHAEPFVMRGRPMAGWLHVAGDGLGGGDLDRWVKRGVSYARSLQPKPRS
jgi:hypothetical protein